MVFINEYCHKKGKKFISCDAFGVFGRVFNDFANKFEVLDKNGEELQDCMIKSISVEEEGIVELLENAKHNFEDGDKVLFTLIEGMTLKEGEKHAHSEGAKDDKPEGINFGCKSTSINNTLHKVTVINRFKFKI
jgi:molybdopterin/thiamine biosynthesis adenylyltransferase